MEIDWNTIISILGQIATLITIMLVYFTLVEMRNQRKASQKPDLVIPKTSIIGYAFDNYEVVHEFIVPIPRFWFNKKNRN